MELNLKPLQCETLKNKLHNLCNFQPKYYDFPGSMPVSLSRNDLKFLGKNYSVCDKTDGTRYFLFCTNQTIYFVDRLLNFFLFAEVNNINDFVYDGELVQDDTYKDKWYFMIFDIFAQNGNTIKDIPNHKRRLESYKNINVHDNVIIQTKKFFYSCDFHKLTKEKYPYKTDGIIFTPIYRKIFNGTDKRTYKWKDSKDHTIDFELQEDGYLYLWDKKDVKIKITKMEYQDKTDKIDVKSPCIVECKIENNGDIPKWIYVKYRSDKERPNSMRTYLSTIDVIDENITLCDLNNNLSIK